MVVLGPSTATWLRKMILPHVPGGRAPLGSGLGATSPNAGVTIAILGDYFRMGYMYLGTIRGYSGILKIQLLVQTECARISC